MGVGLEVKGQLLGTGGSISGRDVYLSIMIPVVVPEAVEEARQARSSDSVQDG